jgi:integrase
VQFAARRMTLEEILPRYYKDKAESKKDTRLSRERILEGFKDILGNPRVDQIDGETMAKWWDHLGEKGGSLNGKGAMKPTSKKSYLITVRAFLNWAIAEGMLKGDPMKRLRIHTRVKSTRIGEFLTEDERERVLKAAHDKPDHLKLILYLGFFAGMRDAEMLAMKKEWIWISPEKDRGTISIQDTAIQFQNDTHGTWQPKGKRTRVIPIHPRLLEFLKTYGMHEPYMLAPEKDRWPDDNKKSKRFDPKKALTALGKKAKVKTLNYHILRHSFATHLAMKGVSLAEIAGLLGDGLKVTEDHYAGFCPSKVNPLAVL